MSVASLAVPVVPVRRIAEYAIPEGKLVLSLEGTPPPWVEPLLKKLTQLSELSDNWNSYGGKPVSPANAWNLWHFLTVNMREGMPLPSLVPTRRGSVLAEWHTHGIDLEIEGVSPSRFAVSYENLTTGEAWESELAGDSPALIDCLRLLQISSVPASE